MSQQACPFGALPLETLQYVANNLDKAELTKWVEAFNGLNINNLTMSRHYLENIMKLLRKPYCNDSANDLRIGFNVSKHIINPNIHSLRYWLSSNYKAKQRPYSQLVLAFDVSKNAIVETRKQLNGSDENVLKPEFNKILQDVCDYCELQDYKSQLREKLSWVNVIGDIWKGTINNEDLPKILKQPCTIHIDLLFIKDKDVALDVFTIPLHANAYVKVSEGASQDNYHIILQFDDRTGSYFNRVTKKMIKDLRTTENVEKVLTVLERGKIPNEGKDEDGIEVHPQSHNSEYYYNDGDKNAAVKRANETLTKLKKNIDKYIELLKAEVNQENNGNRSGGSLKKRQSLNRYTVQQLKAMAKSKGLKVSGLCKADLITALQKPKRGAISC